MPVRPVLFCNIHGRAADEHDASVRKKSGIERKIRSASNSAQAARFACRKRQKPQVLRGSAAEAEQRGVVGSQGSNTVRLAACGNRCGLSSRDGNLFTDNLA